MTKVINPDHQGKRRTQHMRSCAEMLRHLVQKTQMDDEAKDMLATMVFLLREIDEGLEVSAEAWEGRDYWMKAEQLRQKWAWTSLAADELDAIVRGGDWVKIPAQIAKLLPHFSSITISKFMRKPDLWAGQYQRLLDERKK
jgi:hypothetical protein